MDIQAQINQISSQLGLSTTVLFVALIVAIVVILSMVFLLVRQSQKINTLEQPKYGFLGKPLYSMLAIAMLASGFGATYYLVQQPSTIQDVSAALDVTLDITSQVISQTGTKARIQLSVVPTINDTVWGIGAGEYIDIFWNGTGPSNFTEFKLGATQTNPRPLVIDVTRGTYIIKVDILYEGKYYTASEQFTY